MTVEDAFKLIKTEQEFAQKAALKFRNGADFHSIITGEVEAMDWGFTDESKDKVVRIAALAIATLEAQY